MASRRKSNKARLLDLQAACRAAYNDAADHADTFMAPLRRQAMDYYNGEGFGDETTGRSTWVHTELRDTALAVMPHLTRVFCSKTSNIFEFQPRTPRDVASSEAMTDVVNYTIQIENDGYGMTQTLLREALTIPGGGVATWRYEPVDEIEYETYTGLDQAQAAFIRADPEVEVLDETIEVRFRMPDHGLADHHLDHLSALAESGAALPPPGAMLPPGPEEATDLMAGAPMMPPGADVRIEMHIRRTTTGGRIVVEALPPEQFIIDRRARNLDTTSYAAHRQILTVSDLVELGHDRDLVEQHAGDDLDTVTQGGVEEMARNQSIFEGSSRIIADDSMRPVLAVTHYIRFDLDNDGRAEILRVHTVGRDCELLCPPEPVSEIPFATFVMDPTPHSAVSTSSLMEQVADIQRAKSQLIRDIFDGVAQNLNPRLTVVEGMVNMDDVLSAGAIIRQKAQGSVAPLVVPLVAAEALQVISYLDDTRAQRTGVSRVSQGLDADVLQSTSAMAVNQMTEAASARMEQIARNLAEGPFKRMARGVARLIKRHQDKAKVIKLREKWVEIDPRSWTADLDCIVNTGLGRGDDAKRFQLLSQILQLQQTILTTLGPNNPIVSLSQYRNTLSDLAGTGGIMDSTRYFKEITPEIEQALAQAQQGQQKPLDQVTAFMQAESMKAQLTAQTAQQRLALDAAKAQADDDRERDKAAMEFAVKEAEIRGRYATEIDRASLEAEIERDRHAMDFAKHLTTPQTPAQ